MMRKLFLFFMLMTAFAVNAQTKSAVQEVRDYLHECGVFYIATEDGDQPRVRPFGVASICIMTKSHDLSDELNLWCST